MERFLASNVEPSIVQIISRHLFPMKLNGSKKQSHLIKALPFEIRIHEHYSIKSCSIFQFRVPWIDKKCLRFPTIKIVFFNCLGYSNLFDLQDFYNCYIFHYVAVDFISYALIKYLELLSNKLVVMKNCTCLCLKDKHMKIDEQRGN